MPIKLRLSAWEGLTALSAYSNRGIGLEETEGLLADEIKEAFSRYVDFETDTLLRDDETWELELSRAALNELFKAVKIFRGYKPFAHDRCLALRDKLRDALEKPLPKGNQTRNLEALRDKLKDF